MSSRASARCLLPSLAIRFVRFVAPARSVWAVSVLRALRSYKITLTRVLGCAARKCCLRRRLQSQVCKGCYAEGLVLSS